MYIISVGKKSIDKRNIESNFEYIEKIDINVYFNKNTESQVKEHGNKYPTALQFQS